MTLLIKKEIPNEEMLAMTTLLDIAEVKKPYNIVAT